MQPGAGLFVRERMFRVGARLPIAVVAPVPWFPLQAWLKRWRPASRPGAPTYECQRGVDVWYPRFFSIPVLLRRLDGLAMAVGAWPRLRALRAAGRLDIIDAHFAYPDGYAAMLLGRWLGVPVTVTLRGTETRHAGDPALRGRLRRALLGARRVFAVSESLRQVALQLGVPADRTRVVGNGVDLHRFRPWPKAECRTTLGLPTDAKVLVTVGGLVERKGFHRVIELMPAIRARWPELHYLVIGGPSPEGDWTAKLQTQVRSLQLEGYVHFFGAVEPDALASYLGAADVFVLATANEGWANVLLEAMACGLPVVTTQVGGNAEVVSRPELGTIVPFGDSEALHRALVQALDRVWDKAALRRHAEANTWDRRVDDLESEFRALIAVRSFGGPIRSETPCQD
jgi:glycosyltransferase involved in cell wall biosynthesis